MEDRAQENASDFRLDEWVVQPSLNRLCRGEATERVEPKLMDVLVLLASHAGHVVSKDAIADAVWPDVFVTESVITRAIAGLRRALGDDARSPRYIETIAKRGYRLLEAPVLAKHAGQPLGAVPAVAAAAFVPGQWVRGSGFYGRRELIDEILGGNRNWLWLLGNRAVGKTSLLKHLEFLATTSASSEYFPLFWDLQGTTEPEELAADFDGLLADAEDRLAALEIALPDVSCEKDLFTALQRLRRALRSTRRTLLLLFDEVEELIELSRKSPALLRKLRRALQSQEGVRTVMASSSRLWALAEQREDTSPFLHGFAPPLYLGPLDDQAARDLVLHSQRNDGGPTRIDANQVEEILGCCGNHPYLLQLLCARVAELRELPLAVEMAQADPTLEVFFSVDFELLSAAEKRALLAVAEGGGALEDVSGEVGAAVPSGGLLHLERLGMIRRDGETGFRIAGSILARWLLETRPGRA